MTGSYGFCYPFRNELFNLLSEAFLLKVLRCFLVILLSLSYFLLNTIVCYQKHLNGISLKQLSLSSFSIMRQTLVYYYVSCTKEIKEGDRNS